MAPLNNTTNPNSDLRSAQWRGVFFDGPQSDQNPDGDEIPVWTVYIGDEEANPISNLRTFHNYDIASEQAEHLARRWNLELVQDAMPA